MTQYATFYKQMTHEARKNIDRPLHASYNLFKDDAWSGKKGGEYGWKERFLLILEKIF